MNEYIVRETGYPGTLKQEVVGELVRCKDCVWFAGHGYCNKNEMFVENYGWYCADGERKQE